MGLRTWANESSRKKQILEMFQNIVKKIEKNYLNQNGKVMDY